MSFARLLLAHPIVGAGVALLLASRLGAAPWDVFHVGLARLTGLGVGAATSVTGAVAIAVAYVLGIRPGFATLVNALLLGACIDGALAIVPDAASPVVGIIYVAAGVALLGIGTGLYLSAGLGSGPRDSVVLAVARSCGWTVRRARTVVELVALIAGFLLGGELGLATWAYALTVGPAVQWGIAMFGGDL
jgi:uncharacterized membrane protein YczE